MYYWTQENFQWQTFRTYLFNEKSQGFSGEGFFIPRTQVFQLEKKNCSVLLVSKRERSNKRQICNKQKSISWGISRLRQMKVKCRIFWCNNTQRVALRPTSTVPKHSYLTHESHTSCSSVEQVGNSYAICAARDFDRGWKWERPPLSYERSSWEKNSRLCVWPERSCFPFASLNCGDCFLWYLGLYFGFYLFFILHNLFSF